MEVKRGARIKEEGSAGANYERPAMDGSRGGSIFFCQLRIRNETV